MYLSDTLVARFWLDVKQQCFLVTPNAINPIYSPAKKCKGMLLPLPPPTLSRFTHHVLQYSYVRNFPTRPPLHSPAFLFFLRSACFFMTTGVPLSRLPRFVTPRTVRCRHPLKGLPATGRGFGFGRGFGRKASEEGVPVVACPCNRCVRRGRCRTTMNSTV